MERVYVYCDSPDAIPFFRVLVDVASDHYPIHRAEVIEKEKVARISSAQRLRI